MRFGGTLAGSSTGDKTIFESVKYADRLGDRGTRGTGHSLRATRPSHTYNISPCGAEPDETPTPEAAIRPSPHTPEDTESPDKPTPTPSAEITVQPLTYSAAGRL